MAPPKRDPYLRWSEKIECVGDCWLWIAATNGTTPHGRFWHNGRYTTPYRWAYEFFITEVPEGLVLDHLCENGGCCNPWHLDPVTHAVNTARCLYAPATVNGRKTHCNQGHEFTNSNTQWITNKGRKERRCKACTVPKVRERMRKRYRARV